MPSDVFSDSSIIDLSLLLLALLVGVAFLALAGLDAWDAFERRAERKRLIRANLARGLDPEAAAALHATFLR